MGCGASNSSSAAQPLVQSTVLSNEGPYVESNNSPNTTTPQTSIIESVQEDASTEANIHRVVEGIVKYRENAELVKQWCFRLGNLSMCSYLNSLCSGQLCSTGFCITIITTQFYRKCKQMTAV